ncbi:Gfo/Idh/MocA family protein [Lacrimispora sp.]|uniref:Gfo/Idh/MocA family protein n=1 Tax=Lacrimispora sp. TaxID=2719234 RepID=UPI0028977362|nr:Gfo/Idh/MocA family oxidoreductase [Lacrimispora sp.]
MLNVAIIGTGGIARSHANGLLTFPDKCKVVALCDIYPEKAEKFKEEFGFFEARVFGDHTKLFSSGIPINLVHVCTPPSAHAEIAIHAMNAKMNVLVEKPMAPSLKECDEMLAAEAENGVVLGSIAQNRFRNSIYKLKKVLDSGLAGKLRVSHVDSLWWRGHSYYDLWWRGTWAKEGGGPTLNHAVHHIDMINWYTGTLPTEVSSMLANVMHDNSEVEDISFAALKYADGSIAEVTSSVVHHGEEQGLVLQCEKAKLAAPWSCIAQVAKSNGFPYPESNAELMKKIEDYYASIPDLPHESHTGQIGDMLTAIENAERPIITGTDGKKTVELITAIYKAGFEKRTVTLPIEKDDPYYTFEGLLARAPHFYRKMASVENFDVSDIPVNSYKY